MDTRIRGSVITPSARGRSLEPSWMKTETLEFVFVASPLSTQHEGV